MTYEHDLKDIKHSEHFVEVGYYAQHLDEVNCTTVLFTEVKMSKTLTFNLL